MRSAIDILQQAFRVHTGNFVADPTRLNPAKELQTWLAKQKATDGGSKPSLDCLKSAAQDFSGTDIQTLLFRYDRCLPYLLEKNMMAHTKTGALLEYCASHPPTNLRFWRGLVSMYFSFDRNSYPNGIENWRKMQQLIAVKLDLLVIQAQGKREWITYLSAHRDLLTDKPGVQFAEASLRTGQDTTSELKEKLDIPQESWFWTQYLLTKIAVAENSRYFENTISKFITELRKPQFLSVRSEGIKQLLEIYQRKGLGTKEHQGLLEFAIEYWKAPYKNSHADWLRVNDATYQMVLGWYTRKRLNEFIDELRGSNHVKDDRLNFWVNYSQAIGGRFFILLGRDFIEQRRFREIALRYPQNFGSLSGKSTNNVLVFDFGSLYAVVSSELGNALYFYNKQSFPIQLKKCDPMIHGDKLDIKLPDIHLDILKDQHKALTRIVQRDGWQSDAEKELKDHGIYPIKNVSAPTIERNYQQPTPKPTQEPTRYQQPTPKPTEAPTRYPQPTQAPTKFQQPVNATGSEKTRDSNAGKFVVVSSTTRAGTTPAVTKVTAQARNVSQTEPTKYQQPTPKPTQAPTRYQQPSITTAPERERMSTLNVINKTDLEWVKKAKQVANKYGLKTEDKLAKGGNFWILVDQKHKSYFDALKEVNNLGFRMKVDKGFWKKEDEPVT